MNKDYDEFMSSPEWGELRQKRLYYDHFRCQDCGIDDNNAILNVHHLNYDRFGGEENVIEDLITLCSVCHEKRHQYTCPDNNFFGFELKDSEEDSFPPADGYVCRIINIEVNQEKQYLMLTTDIAEGVYSSYGADVQRKHNKKYGFIKLCFSWKSDKARYMSKKNLKIIIKDNPEIPELFQDINDGNFQVLINCYVGVVAGRTFKTSASGARLYSWLLGNVTPITKIHAGDYNVPVDTQQN